ncbi:MAG: peptide chain release factor N(5)-glutamine methyltransferase, partial [bacterium]|nr:peptide chain release factor N(5)-glutamine methyltransferase [bacterium]
MRQIKRCQKSSQKRKNRQDRPEKEIINLLQKAKTILANSGIERPIFEAELILAHLLKIERYNLYVDPPPPSHRIIDEFFLLVSKRTRHIPLAYILKKTYFAGYEFYISKGVFIPRPETEAIISCVCQFIKDTNRKINILDICTGCGALAITLAKLFPFSCVIATDVSKKAVQIARKNVSLHNLQSRISVVNADIVPGNLHEKFSLIVSNPPYLTGNEIEQAEEEVKKEPFYSLYGGKNG